jgi:hypothetical protein
MKGKIALLAISLFLGGLLVIASCHGGHKSYVFIDAPELVKYLGLTGDGGLGTNTHAYVTVGTTGTVLEVEGDDFIVHPYGHQGGQHTAFQLEGNFLGSPLALDATIVNQANAYVVIPRSPFSGSGIGEATLVAVNYPGGLRSNPHPMPGSKQTYPAGIALKVTYVFENAVTLTKLTRPDYFRYIFPGQSGIKVEISLYNDTGEPVTAKKVTLGFAASATTGATDLNPYFLAFWDHKASPVSHGATGVLTMYLAATNDLPGSRDLVLSGEVQAEGANSKVMHTLALSSIPTVDPITTGAAPSISTKGGDTVGNSVNGGGGGNIMIDATGTVTLGSAGTVTVPGTPSTAGFLTITSHATTVNLITHATGILIDTGETLSCSQNGIVLQAPTVVIRGAITRNDTLEIILDATDIFVVGGEINTSGEASPTQSHGGHIGLLARGNLVLSGAKLKAEGGANTASGGAPNGGDGGPILLMYPMPTNAPLIIAGSTVSTAGGTSRTGKGGNAGPIDIHSSGGTVEMDASSVLNATGGHNMGGLSHGGDSLNMNITAGSGDVNLYGTILAEGGDGVGGQGGKGGPVMIQCANVAIGNASGKPVLYSAGGSSTIAGGWGYRGGVGGLIQIEAQSAITIPEGAGLISFGGAGDQNNTGTSIGGNITVRAHTPAGDIHIAGVLNSQGGFCRDQSTSPTSPSFASSGGQITIESYDDLHIAGTGLVSSQGGYPALEDPTVATADIGGGNGAPINIRVGHPAATDATGVLTLAGWVISNGGGAIDRISIRPSAGSAGPVQIDPESEGPSGTSRTTISGHIWAVGGPKLFGSPDPGTGGNVDIDMRDSGTVTGDDILISGEILANSTSGNDAQTGKITIDVAGDNDDIEISGRLESKGSSGAGIEVNYRNGSTPWGSHVTLTGTARLEVNSGHIRVFSNQTQAIEIQDNALCKVTGTSGNYSLWVRHIGTGLIDVDGDLETTNSGMYVQRTGSGSISIGSTANLKKTGFNDEDVWVGATDSSTNDSNITVGGTITCEGGDVRIENYHEGTITLRGNIALTPDGGTGDQIEIWAHGSATSIVNVTGGSLIADGATSTYVNGGKIYFRSTNGSITESVTISDATLSANGYSTTGGIAGGTGGAIIFDQPKSIEISTSSNMTVNGGSSSGGIAGAGGEITFDGDNSSPEDLYLSGGTLEARGGASTGTSSAGIPLEGGQGGTITIQEFVGVTLDRAVDLSGGNCEGGHAGLGGSLSAKSGIQKFTGTANVTLNGGTSTFTSGGGGTGGKMEVILVPGTTSPDGITVSGTLSSIGGAGNAYGGDGGTFYLDATQSDTTIVLTNAAFDVSGGSGGTSGQVGSAGSVTAYTDPPAVVQDPTTPVTPSGAYIKRP